MSIQSYVKEWVILDNNIKKITKEIIELRKQKTELNDNIFTYLKENNMTDTTINISDGKLNFGTTQSFTTLTFKFLEECLNDYFNDDNKTKEILKYIKNKRNINYTNNIKRTYK